MTAKNILGLVPTIHAASLASSLAKDATKKDEDIDDILHSATKALVGTSLIKVESSLIAGLWILRS